MVEFVITLAIFVVLFGIALLVVVFIFGNRILQLERNLKYVNDHYAKITHAADILISAGLAGVNQRISNTQLDLGNLEDTMEDVEIAINTLNELHALPKVSLVPPIDDDALFPDVLRGRFIDPQDQCACNGACEDYEDCDLDDEQCRNCGG